jgi:hypothetical protein
MRAGAKTNDGTLVIIFIALILIGLLFSATSKFFYILSRVDQNQVGVKFRSGKIYEIVGPGVYRDAGLYVELKRVSSQAVPFSVKYDTYPGTARTWYRSNG